MGFSEPAPTKLKGFLTISDASIPNDCAQDYWVIYTHCGFLE